MKVKHLMDQIKHIDIVINDLKKLASLEEDFIYEIESKAGFEYNIDLMVDVSTDAMGSWKKFLQNQCTSECSRTFEELLESSGMNQSEFSRHFHIPLRTVQHWVAGTRKCPPYVLELMEYKLNNEGMIKGEV